MKMTSFMKDGIPTVRVENVSDLEGLTLIDVRGPDEFVGELGHIKGAVLKTLRPEFENYLKQQADKEKEILLICRSGGRSGMATSIALQYGFTKIYNMEGGMLFWNSRRLPVTFDNE